MICSVTRARPEVADILRAHGDTYRDSHPVSPEQGAVLRHLTACRTAALGGHVDSCGACGFVRLSYNSCRDRHCPKCQGTRQSEWLQARLARLLPVEYFHVVFTLPQPLRPLALKNRRFIYNLIFQAASETLLAVAADPQRLGGQIGFTAILHTWSQNLGFHPHLHCVVTGGGLSRDGTRWVAAREGYFLPVKVLAKLFRGKFLAALRNACEQGQLILSGSSAPLVESRRFQRFLTQLYRQDWIVYAKPSFGTAEHVYRYLGRYTHRVAISNGRLVSLQEDRVCFRYKDYADGSRIKQMTLTAEQFIGRFLLHVLPKRFVRIRHYGLLAGRNVTTKFAICQRLLHCHPSTAEPTPNEPPSDAIPAADTLHQLHCPRCQAILTRRPINLPNSPWWQDAPIASITVNDSS